MKSFSAKRLLEPAKSCRLTPFKTANSALVSRPMDTFFFVRLRNPFFVCLFIQRTKIGKDLIIFVFFFYFYLVFVFVFRVGSIFLYISSAPVQSFPFSVFLAFRVFSFSDFLFFFVFFFTTFQGFETDISTFQKPISFVTDTAFLTT